MKRPRPTPAGPALALVYARLREARGPLRWWPGESAFEVCLGAILTQNTAWANVERALDALRSRDLLRYEALKALPVEELAALIRPAGTFRVKARRLAAFLAFLGERYGGRPEAMAATDRWTLRRELLAVPGIGPETADCIVLYAAGLPVFVIDAYTRRLLGRLGLARGDESYEALQEAFLDALPADAALFNDYHAQIVEHAKEVCRKVPRCEACVLAGECRRAGLPAPGDGASRRPR